MLGAMLAERDIASLAIATVIAMIIPAFGAYLLAAAAVQRRN